MNDLSNNFSLLVMIKNTDHLLKNAPPLKKPHTKKPHNVSNAFKKLLYRWEVQIPVLVNEAYIISGGR